jgi:hypothetical protein
MFVHAVAASIDSAIKAFGIMGGFPLADRSSGAAMIPTRAYIRLTLRATAADVTPRSPRIRLPNMQLEIRAKDSPIRRVQYLRANKKPEWTNRN